MSSHFPAVHRRVPSQHRGKRRVAGILNAAACVIAETGYEAATMSEVADRAGASIGSLYQFFPNKEAITQALCADYAHEIEALWAPLGSRAKTLNLGSLVNGLIDLTIAFAEEHPAFLALLDAPPAARAPTAIRKRFRELVAGFLLAAKPRMSRVKALRMATVTLKIINGMMVLYKEAKRDEKAHIVQEFKFVLGCYVNRGVS